MLKKYVKSNYIVLLLLLVASAFFVTVGNYILERKVAASTLESESRQLSVLTNDLLQERFALLNSNIHFLIKESEDRYRSNESKSALARSFKHLIEGQEKVFQARILDGSGKEQIKVIRRSTGSTEIVEGDSLQDKSGMSYFEEFKRASSGEIIASHVNLNMENGVIDVPIKPTMRWFYKYANRENDTLYIGLNINLKTLLRPVIQEIEETELVKIALSNGQGVILIDPSAKLHVTHDYEVPESVKSAKSAKDLIFDQEKRPEQFPNESSSTFHVLDEGLGKHYRVNPLNDNYYNWTLSAYFEEEAVHKLAMTNLAATLKTNPRPFLEFFFLFLAFATLHGIFWSQRKNKKLLRKKNDDLRSLVASREEFVTLLSHDLRSPFNSMIGLTKIIAKEADSISREELRKSSSLLHNQAQSSLFLVDRLLQWGKLQSEGITKIDTEFSPQNLLDKCLDLYSFDIQSKQLSVAMNCNGLSKVIADKHIIETVIRNLLSNAIKYTPAKGEIYISCYTSKKEMVLKVSDSGIGIPPEHIQRLKKISTNKSRPGTEQELGNGLGLPLTFKLLKIIEAESEIVSVINEGTKFIITIPVKTA